MKVLRAYIRYYMMRLLLFFAVVTIIFSAYFFKNTGVDLVYITIYNPLYSITRDLSGFVFSIYFLISLFWLAILFEIIFIIFFKNSKNKKTELRNRNDNFLIPLLFSYLYKNYEIDKLEEVYQLRQFKKELNNDYSRVKFIDTLRHIHNLIKGDARTRNDFIFKTIGLEKFIKYYLHSPNVQNKIFALSTISDFRLEGNSKYIKRLLKSRNQALRSAAIIAKINQNETDDLHFFVDWKIVLTEWDINQIIITVKQYKNIDYLTLINSNDKKISTLGIRLTYLHKRIELKPTIAMLISRETGQLNEDLFMAYATFANSKADFDNLFYKFELTTFKTQIEVVKVITLSPEKELAVNFLKWLIDSKPVTLKLEALKQLLELDMASFSMYRDNQDSIIYKAYLQVIDLNT